MYVCHYVSMHYARNWLDLETTACGSTTAIDWIKNPRHYNERDLRLLYLTEYVPCQSCLTSKTLENDLLEVELGRE